jgi:hypothetical protein
MAGGGAGRVSARHLLAPTVRVRAGGRDVSSAGSGAGPDKETVCGPPRRSTVSAGMGTSKCQAVRRSGRFCRRQRWMSSSLSRVPRPGATSGGRSARAATDLAGPSPLFGRMNLGRVLPGRVLPAPERLAPRHAMT